MLKMISVNKTYSTKEAARKIEIHWVTLHRWMAAGKVRPSHQIGLNGGKHWRWTDRDIQKARKYKANHYREGRGRKKKVEVKKAK
jgi:predicted site-specific integrase-resolvase